MVPALPGVKMMPANDLEGCRQPALVTERRSRCQDAQCLFHLVVATTGKPCPQVGSLHGSRATAAEHQETEFCQPFAENDYLTVHPIGARQGMAAHHTHYLQVVVCFHEISQGVFDALVVKHARRGLINAFGEFSRRHEMLKDTQIVIVLFRLRKLRTIAHEDSRNLSPWAISHFA